MIDLQKLINLEVKTINELNVFTSQVFLGYIEGYWSSFWFILFLRLIPGIEHDDRLKLIWILFNRT